MSFIKHYFVEEDTNMVPVFLDAFKKNQLPMNVYQENHQNERDEWHPFSVEISKADTILEGENENEKEMKTHSFLFEARFGVHDMFSGEKSKYNPEQFYDRELLMSMKNDILGILNSGRRIIVDENVIAPDDYDISDLTKAVAAGTYGTKFDTFYDVQEKEYKKLKRQLGYDTDYFIIAHGIARKS